jgi:hypothetical protein
VPFIAGVTFDDYAWMIVGRSVTQQIYTQEGAGHDIYNALACGLVAQPVLARSFGHTGPDLYRIPRLDRVKEKVLSSNEAKRCVDQSVATTCLPIHNRDSMSGLGSTALRLLECGICTITL